MPPHYGFIMDAAAFIMENFVKRIFLIKFRNHRRSETAAKALARKNVSWRKRDRAFQ